MILSVFLALLLLLHPQEASAKVQKKVTKKGVMLTTIPKSGTHLLMKCITLMNIKGINFEYWKKPKGHYLNNLEEKIPQPIIDAFVHDKRKTLARHLIYTPESEQFLKNHTHANFFMIRDPRAQLVSQAFAFQKARIGGQEKSLEDIMLDMILGRKENFLPLKRHLKHQHLPDHIVVTIADLFWKIGLYEFYKLFLPWMKAENFYTVRFETLIGEQGGGSKESQVQEIKNIAKHLGTELSDAKITEITNELFGGTGTFREGKKDSWKQHFSSKVTEAFKANAGLMQLLIDLGYEKDINW